MIRLLLLIQLFIFNCFAIVDIASIDFGEKDAGLSGSFYGSFQKKRGNTHKDESEYGGRIQYDTNKTITWLQGFIEHDEASGKTTDDNAFAHLRHIHQLFSPEWAMEFYLQFKQDRFKNLKERRLIGIGPRYKIVDSPSYGKLFFGLSVMDERIKYNAIDPAEHNYRISSYFSYNYSVNKMFELSYIGYYQPKIDNGSDYTTASLAEMTIHLSKVFDLSYLLEFDYDSEPPYGIQRTDSRQRLSFIYRFAQDDPLSVHAQNMLNSSLSLENAKNSSISVASEAKNVKVEDVNETFMGEWRGKSARFLISVDGKGYHMDAEGIYEERITWRLISTEVTENKQAKVVIISFVDEEGRVSKAENYLWSENTLIGLSGSNIKAFRREACASVFQP